MHLDENKEDRTLDVITVGRASVDLYCDQIGGRLEDALTFSKYVGGCPANIAIGVSRLGLNAGIITAVGDDHFGRFIVEQMQREGVATAGIKKDEARLTALAILGIRDPDTFPLMFYRENCADMAIEVSDLKEDFVRSTKAILISGTHLSTPGTRRTSKSAMSMARHAGARVVLDIDYRPVLWGLTAPDSGEIRFVADPSVTKELQSIIPDCDLIVGTEEEFHILGGNDDTVSAIRAVRRLSDAVIVCKLGERGCVVFQGSIPDSLEGGILVGGHDVEVFNVLGAGDGFMSGFLRGWLRDMPLDQCCELANGCGAIVVSRHGCSPAIPTWPELSSYLENGSKFRALRKDTMLEQLHWSTSRPKFLGDVAVLAVDHRSIFEELTTELGVESAAISSFKALILEALEGLGAPGISFGLLMDGQYGSRVLESAIDKVKWIGRPIETPGSCPLEFATEHDVATEINSWPTQHIVKCLCLYHPDHSVEVRAQQDRQLQRLFSACRNTRHQFLLEIILGSEHSSDATTTATVIRHIYSLGIYPDWWKLEPSVDLEAWRNIHSVVSECDANCQGIVVLGLSSDIETLSKSFQVAATFDTVRGFAVGRTVFADAARHWLSGSIDDSAVIATVRSNFIELLDAWRSAK